VRGDDTAITFPGTSGNYANTPNGLGEAGDIHAIGCWFKSSSSTATITFMTLRATTSALSSDAPLVCVLNNPSTGQVTVFGGGSSCVSSAGSSYNDGNKHFIVVSSTSPNSSMWIDGAYEGAGAFGGLGATQVAMGLGANVSNTNVQNFPGTVDEPFHIYGRVLTTAQILSLYNAGLR
jgi:hypothetical protein